MENIFLSKSSFLYSYLFILKGLETYSPWEVYPVSHFLCYILTSMRIDTVFSYCFCGFPHPTLCKSLTRQKLRESLLANTWPLSLTLQLQVTIFKAKGHPCPHPFGTNVHQPSNLCLKEMMAVWAAIPSLQMVHILYLVWEVKFRKAISLKA